LTSGGGGNHGRVAGKGGGGGHGSRSGTGTLPR
jgi:hypothetical protein